MAQSVEKESYGTTLPQGPLVNVTCGHNVWTGQHPGESRNPGPFLTGQHDAGTNKTVCSV